MEHFVGIDVAKDRLDVHLRPSGESFTVIRDGEGLVQLVDRLHRLAPRLVVMEATGVYWKPVWAVLEDSFELMLVNARHVKQWNSPDFPDTILR